MKPLWLIGVSGLYQEFYQPDTQALISKINKIKKYILDSGIIFWRTLLQPEKIKNLVNALEENIHNPIHQIPQFLGVVGNRDKFISNVLDYRISICDQGIGPKQFFKKIETLAILCELYSRFEFFPFQLSIQNGFLLDDVSAKEIVYNCQSISHNPYITFINDEILPLIYGYSPDVIFCTGRISYFNIALAKMVKKKLPDVHICFTRHSSEYFSLNKITKYLKNNTTLFSVIDSIILEYFDETEQILLETIRAKKNIFNIPNILTFKKECEPDRTKQKANNKSSISIIIGRRKQVVGLKIPPDKIYDIHFNPYTKCYWNKCVFCGINKKYSHENCVETKENIEIKLKILCRQLPVKSFLWFIDEAIHPSKLSIIAEYFISSNKKFVWQARCRIDHGLLADGLPKKLAQSGLKELRLGLESASIRVLRLMNKFEDGFKLKMVHKIIKAYSEYGISIHFPIIVGFPGEEIADRQKTYEFLSCLREKYPLVTFNINIFAFDVSSTLFKVWDNYSISKIMFPCSPTEFIGNIVNWDDSTKISDSILERERNSFMRNKLYPWMPPKTLIPPTIFYRLSETIRNTLIWKSDSLASDALDFSDEKVIQRSPNLVVQKKIDGEYLSYNWDTHHYIEGNEMMLHILNEWVSPKSISEGVRSLCQGKDEMFYEDDIIISVKKLLLHGHFLAVGNENGDINGDE